jgi:hypothetical protein
LTGRRADPIISAPCFILVHRALDGDDLTRRNGVPVKVTLAALVLAAAGGRPADPAQGNQAAQPPGPGIPAAAPARPAMAPPLPAGPAPDLTLVFTDQVIGYVEPCG